MIQSQPGRGYRFSGPVDGVEPDPAPGLDLPGAAQGAPPPERGQPVQVTPSGAGSFRAAQRLAGRDDELAFLEGLLAGARGGQGALVLLTGEPGIGKSALVTALAAEATLSGGVVLKGRAVPSGGPFRPLAEAMAPLWRLGISLDAEPLRPFRYALGRVLPAGTAQTPHPVREAGVDPVVLLAEGLLALLTSPQLSEEAGSGVRVLVVEDVHDADPDTVAVLEYLAAGVADHPVLVLLTRRDWPRPATLERLAAAPHVRRLPLGRLPEEAVGELVDSVREPDWRDALEVVAMDGFTEFKTASAEELPDAVAVMDPSTSCGSPGTPSTGAVGGFSSSCTVTELLGDDRHDLHLLPDPRSRPPQTNAEAVAQRSSAYFDKTASSTAGPRPVDGLIELHRRVSRGSATATLTAYEGSSSAAHWQAAT